MGKRKKISAKVRAEAVLICQLAASNTSVVIGCFSGAASDLAWDAYVSTNYRFDESDWPAEYAEAAQLLLEGWCPGDPVRVLP